MLLPHLASRLYGTPLLLARTKLDIILAVLGARVGWHESQTVLACRRLAHLLKAWHQARQALPWFLCMAHWFAGRWPWTRSPA